MKWWPIAWEPVAFPTYWFVVGDEDAPVEDAGLAHYTGSREQENGLSDTQPVEP